MAEITDISISENPLNPCNSVTVTITTDVQATGYGMAGDSELTPVSTNPFSFTRSRAVELGAVFGAVFFAGGQSKGFSQQIPAQTNITTETYLDGSLGVISITNHSYGTPLEYQLTPQGGVPTEWTTDTMFTGLETNKSYSLLYRDQYGCTKEKILYIQGVGISVSGLNSSGYYINNDILVNLSNPNPNFETLNYEIQAINVQSQEIQNFTVYPKVNGTLTVNLSPVLKSMFKLPKHQQGNSLIHENSAREVFNFIFKANGLVGETPQSFQVAFNGKVFYRGGVRNNRNNVSIIANSVLRSSETLPYWNGYFTEEYRAGESLNIVKVPVDNVLNKERMKVKGCNPVYLKFLNSKGGYSYWLFESNTETSNTSNSGYSNALGNIIDFGNEVDSPIQVYSKVPERFYGLIFDLIESPEIYIFGSNQLSSYDSAIRIISDNNKLDRNNFKKVYEVKLNFKRVTNYNPQVLWQ